MSKLSEMIRASQTNERRCVMTPLMSLTSIMESPNTDRLSPMYYVYSFKAELGCEATVQYGATGELDAKLKVIRRQVIEAVFGEFRDDIHAIQRALMSYDTQKASDATDELYRRMFEI